MFSFLNKPYPYYGSVKRNLITNLIIGIFIALFLIVFEPFNINQWETDNKTIKLLGYGFVSFFVPTLFEFLIKTIIPKKTLEDAWKVKYEILVIVIVLFFIAFGNMLYGNLIGATRINLQSFLNALWIVASMCIFPVTFFVVLKHNRLLKTNLSSAVTMNKQLELLHDHKKENTLPQDNKPVTQNLSVPVPEKISKKIESEIIITAENEKDKLILKPIQLLYIESADNYSNVVYMDSGIRKKQLMRSSLKRIESQISDDKIIRCHRTFIVNLYNIKSIEGNAAGYKLYFNNDQETVPVSRNFGPTIIEKLKMLR